MDVCVTVPKGLWTAWIEEGQLPGEPFDGATYHFWIPQRPLPDILPGERVYIVAHGKLRGYAPLERLEEHCKLTTFRACLMRIHGAKAVTIDEPISGFQGWRYRFWDRADEKPFPDWRQP